ncbi:hypothetical protein ACF0H5_016016 [Mactra antiquata]
MVNYCNLRYNSSPSELRNGVILDDEHNVHIDGLRDADNTYVKCKNADGVVVDTNSHCIVYSTFTDLVFTIMPGSQCCLYAKQEFQCKHLGFAEVHPARFSFFQWRVPLCVVLIYRLILAVYCAFWLIYTTIVIDVNVNGLDVSTFAFLTTWTYIVLTVYLILHFLSCLLYACRRGGSVCERMSNENHRQMFHELHVQPSLWGSNDFENVGGIADDEELNGEMRTITLSWLTKLVWLFYNVASSASIMVSLLFWVFIFPQLGELSGYEMMVNLQLHAVTSVIIIIEHCVSAVPIRILHYTHTLTYGIIYIIFSGIYYAVDHRHVLYPILDWGKPEPTAIMLIITAFVVLPIIQLILFLIYKLRIFIFDRCNPELL